MKILQPQTMLHWLRIYHLYQTTFPASEKKPFSIIRSMNKKGKSDVWYVQNRGKFAGFVITINGDDIILLDYLAVASHMRGKGIGSIILQKMRKLYIGKGVFLEIETVLEKADNIEERKRRKQFYLQNGMTEMHVLANLFGVNMELLGFDCILDFEGYQNFYRDNYGEYAVNHIKPVTNL